MKSNILFLLILSHVSLVRGVSGMNVEAVLPGMVVDDNLRRLGPDDILFPNAGKEPGVEIWRIGLVNRKHTPIRIPEDGCQFETTETYIILKTTASNFSTQHVLFYWLGADSKNGKDRATAIYAMQLAIELQNKVVELYRVVENYEPVQFTSTFPKVFATRAGSEVQLFRVKGMKHANFEKVEPRIESLNKQDSFILKSRNSIFIYYGDIRTDVEFKKLRELNPYDRDSDSSIKTPTMRMKIRFIYILNESDEHIRPFVKTLGASIYSLRMIPTFTEFKLLKSLGESSSVSRPFQVPGGHANLPDLSNAPDTAMPDAQKEPALSSERYKKKKLDPTFLREKPNVRPISAPPTFPSSTDRSLSTSSNPDSSYPEESHAESFDDKRKTDILLMEYYNDVYGKPKCKTHFQDSWKKSELQTTSCYVLSVRGYAEVFTWIGNKASAEIRRYVMADTETMCQDDSYPYSKPVKIIVEGDSCLAFDSVFQDFDAKDFLSN